MMFINLIIILLSALNTESRYLRIKHYDNVTLRSCGWSSHSFETANNNCFSWHKTYKQIRSEQAIAGIRGGRDAKIGEFPYNALIRKRILINNVKKGWIECTGAIINSKWIVTAAHCLPKNLMGNYSVFVGFTFNPKYSKLNTPINVTNVYLHPNYSETYYGEENDIGLIRLDTEIDFRSDSINSVCLPDSTYEIEENMDEDAVTCGWGRINANQTNFRRLQTLKIRLSVSKTENKLIESDDNTSGILCHGDSGGPLVKYIKGQAVLIGINSRTRGKHCESGTKMLFVSVPRMVSWMVEIIQRNV